MHVRMSREIGTERVGRDFFFFSRGFHFKDSEGVSLAVSRLLQHAREWMKQLSHLNTHSGNPPLSTMPGRNRKSINTYNAFYLFSNSSPFTKSSICGVETGATCRWWLFVVWQLPREGMWEVVRCGRWVFEDVKITELEFSDDQRWVAEWTPRSFPSRGKKRWETASRTLVSTSISFSTSPCERPRSRFLLPPWALSFPGRCVLITRGL